MGNSQPFPKNSQRSDQVLPNPTVQQSIPFYSDVKTSIKAAPLSDVIPQTILNDSKNFQNLRPSQSPLNTALPHSIGNNYSNQATANQNYGEPVRAVDIIPELRGVPATNNDVYTAQKLASTQVGLHFNQKTKVNNLSNADVQPYAPFAGQQLGTYANNPANSQGIARSNSKFQVFDSSKSEKTAERDFGVFPFEKKSYRGSQIFQSARQFDTPDART